ncbi:MULTISPECIES: LPS assembly lipoprotein LptE [Salegentibacter]|uniref:Lipopolysaccharide-assembly n=1 Tax=Salegentibacter agarivorans TaxID=345907 RepID=A0A1I2MNB3_9FLAO|nr:MULTISPECIES: LptE family protein [Salegentibacter]SFF92984.1 Lipopolysaccharide-assembly [Salegentibacter agarivorans]|tara:strand:+ start:1169 stop:1672 length:504 start_codon:yes stop_codon:yes gene_type:complete
MKKTAFLLCFVLLLSTQSCGIYSFTGADTGDAESFQVNFFQNQADLVEPGIDRTFTLQLQDLIQNQTSLSLANNNADLIFEGEIIDFYVAPITATAENTAAQNRLTIAVNVRYYNTLEPEKDFERRFSFYYDYPANAQLVGDVLATALDEIYNRLTQDIFNAALTDW